MIAAPGRNDPCPCGSGRKYKQCHLQADRDIDLHWRHVREAEGKLVPEMLAYALDRWGESYVEAAWTTFAGDAIPLADAPADREFDTTFVPWFLFDFHSESVQRRTRRREWPGRPAAREYLEEHRSDLSSLEVRYLESALSRPLSFVVVTAVAPGRSLDLRDVLTGRTCRVLERSASMSLEPSALLLARIVSVGDVSIMVGAGGWVVPPAFHNPIIAFREGHAPRGAMLDDEAVRALHVEVAQFYRDIVDELMTPRPPKLVNTDGDPIAPTEVHVELRCTPREAFDRLVTLAYGSDADSLLADATVDRAGNVTAVTVPWSVAGNRMHREWENTSLGTIEIKKRRMTISVNSERRAKKIRSLVAKRLGADALFVRQQVQSIEALLEKGDGPRMSARERAANEALQARPEVRAMMREMGERHWAAWLDGKVPALGNVTPLEAAKSRAGRERLEGLLADFAWRAKDMSPEQRPDIAGIRSALGLDHPLGDEP